MSKLFLVLDFVCNSRATCLLIYSGIGHNTYSRCSEPLSHSASGNERLPIRLKLLIASSYFALDIFVSFNSRVTSATFLDVIDQIVNLVEVRSPRMPTLYSFVSTMEFRKKGRRLHLDDLKQRNEDINVLDRPLREEQARMRRTARFVTKLPPLTPLLNLGTRFLIVEENCDARIIKLQ